MMDYYNKITITTTNNGPYIHKTTLFIASMALL
jgi:hypothetical protein